MVRISGVLFRYRGVIEQRQHKVHGFRQKCCAPVLCLAAFIGFRLFRLAEVAAGDVPAVGGAEFAPGECLEKIVYTEPQLAADIALGTFHRSVLKAHRCQGSQQDAAGAAPQGQSAGQYGSHAGDALIHLAQILLCDLHNSPCSRIAVVEVFFGTLGTFVRVLGFHIHYRSSTKLIFAAMLSSNAC